MFAKRIQKFLGHEVRNKINGFEGICVLIDIRANGNLQVALQRKGEKDQEYAVDEQAMEVIGPGLSSTVKKLEEPLYGIGQRVKSKLSDFEGTVYAIAYHLNGCLSYAIMAQELSEKGKESAVSYSQELIEAVLEDKPIEEIAQTRTGGPSTPFDRSTR